ncbi:hypothetical protein L228DRAFT_127110 [Xylona heveae TC161]|uniref:Uncharacterized protein n=1 Tax=Xylona heveae (strain CBS 132557 / TC161) TaxID=1328760 RepID=A0A165GR43_XYLHT|nr:hypothetical protein L228DRAFT_127110 [Xylona heveae TC161]KZF22489.1 hypothetical protein L228DRAFT_127110 [Xylona heveae TC161]
MIWEIPAIANPCISFSVSFFVQQGPLLIPPIENFPPFLSLIREWPKHCRRLMPPNRVRSPFFLVSRFPGAAKLCCWKCVVCVCVCVGDPPSPSSLSSSSSALPFVVGRHPSTLCLPSHIVPLPLFIFLLFRFTLPPSLDGNPPHLLIPPLLQCSPFFFFFAANNHLLLFHPLLFFIFVLLCCSGGSRRG